LLRLLGTGDQTPSPGSDRRRDPGWLARSVVGRKQPGGLEC